MSGGLGRRGGEAVCYMLRPLFWFVLACLACCLALVLIPAPHCPPCPIPWCSDQQRQQQRWDWSRP